MAWVKLDDAMPHHPKVMAAGVQAFALDVAGICYSNKHATDGYIADYALPAVLPSLPSPRRWANKLVEVGRWHKVDGGYEIHDVQDYQPSAEQQKELSKKRAEAGRRGGSKSGESRRSKPEANEKQVASTEPNPVPSRPDLEPNTPSPDGSVDEVEQQFEEHFWPAYPPRNGRKVEKGKALVEWRKLTLDQRRRALIGARNLAASDTLPKDAHRFLRKNTAGEFPFDDWQTSVTRLQQTGRPAPPPRPCPQCGDQYVPDNFDGGVPASHGCETGALA